MSTQGGLKRDFLKAEALIKRDRCPTSLCSQPLQATAVFHDPLKKKKNTLLGASSIKVSEFSVQPYTTRTIVFVGARYKHVRIQDLA